MRAQKIDILPKFHPKPPIFRTNSAVKTANGGTLVRSTPHKTPLKKGTSSLRSEVKNVSNCSNALKRISDKCFLPYFSTFEANLSRFSIQ